MHTRTLFTIGSAGKGGWQHTPDAPIYLASHRPSCNIALTRAPRLLAWAREGGRERGENSSFNMAADKESEWIQPTWAPQPGSPYLPFSFFFFSHLPPPIHPPPSVSELQISPCVSSQARREIRSEVLDVSAIGACCSFSIVFILFSAFIYLSVTTWMYGFLPLYTRMRGDFCLWER